MRLDEDVAEDGKQGNDTKRAREGLVLGERMLNPCPNIFQFVPQTAFPKLCQMQCEEFK